MAEGDFGFYVEWMDYIEKLASIGAPANVCLDLFKKIKTYITTGENLEGISSEALLFTEFIKAPIHGKFSLTVAREEYIKNISNQNNE